MGDVIELRPRQAKKLTRTGLLDLHVQQLEARVICAVAHHLVTGDDQHLPSARMNAIQRSQRLGVLDEYFEEVYAALKVLPTGALARLYHPSRAYSRRAQQDVINGAQAAL